VLRDLAGVGADELQRLHATSVVYDSGMPAPAAAQLNAEQTQQVVL
jgi:hypothetical protein